MEANQQTIPLALLQLLNGVGNNFDWISLHSVHIVVKQTHQRRKKDFPLSHPITSLFFKDDFLFKSYRVT